MTATDSPLIYQEDGAIARITLNRPHVLNALTFDSYALLRDIFTQFKEKPAIKVVVITGAGRAFCSGGDVREIIGRLQGRSDDELLAFTRLTCEVVLRMRETPQPIIASINGVATGAGAVLATASDLRIASESARFAFLFVKVGLSGADMGMTYLLPRLVGQGRASDLLLRGDFVDATTAERWGLVNRVVPADQLERETQLLAESVAAGPSFGLQMTKRILNRAMGVGLGEILDIEAEAQAICMKHPDFQEAHRAFLEKRPPRFGRTST